MKRILATILAGLLLLSSLTACAAGDTPSDDAQSSEAVETRDENFPAIQKQDYNGETFHMIGWAAHGEWLFAEEYKTTSQDINVLNNTVYEMNTIVEEYLNVELSFEAVPISTGREVI